MLGKKTSFGLDIGTHSIKCVQLESKDGNVILKNGVIKEIYAQGQKYDPEKDDSSRVVSALTDTFKEMGVSPKKLKNLISSLSGSSVNVKHIRTVPLTSDELENSLRFEARKHMPISGSEMILDFQILDIDNDKRDDSEMDVLLVVTNQKAFQKHISILKDTGLVPGIVDVDVLATFNAYYYFNSPSIDEILLFLNIGAERTSFTIYDPTGLFFTRNLSYGGNHFTVDLMKKYEVEYEIADRIKIEKGLFMKKDSDEDTSDSPEINISIGEKPSYESMIDEIHRSLRYYFKETGKNTFAKIILTGGSARIPEMDSYLAEQLNIPVEIYNPLRNIQISDKFDIDTGPQLAQAIGLALRFNK